MNGFVDLHCHWVAGIDDGAPDPSQGILMLQRLHEAGFDQVIATPHMRPGLFDNTRPDLERAYDAMKPHLDGVDGLPETALSSEHYFDDVVYERLLKGEAVPYPGNRAALLEFYEIDFPPSIERAFFELRRRGLLPVIAHPERYRCLWKNPERLERLVDAGAVALLDAAAVVGKYGRAPRDCALDLLEQGLYSAACSDAHRPDDVAQVVEGMRWIEREFGHDEIEVLFREGPREILAGSHTT